MGIRALAELHGISETYLSKIFTKLSKAEIVRSMSGVKGGYVLHRPAEEISFWDIIEAFSPEKKATIQSWPQENGLKKGLI